jgi:transposase
MNDYHYIGFDVHKKKIQYCIKTAEGKILEQGKLDSRPEALQEFAARQSGPWKGLMEATMFSYWIYDVLAGSASELRIAHPLLAKALMAGKHKSDKIDARKLADIMRCNWIPSCYVPPAEVRSLRRLMRFREGVKRQTVQTKNRIACTLMEVGVEYNRSKLHGKKYFHNLLDQMDQVPVEVKEVLRYARASLEMFAATQRRIFRQLQAHSQLKERVERLRSIQGVGLITALTWALEVGEPQRFSSLARALSYCGLVSGQNQSADKDHGGPLSKQRNRYLQSTLIEAAKLAPQFNSTLDAVFQKVRQKKSANQATIIVARKLVASLLAVDRSGQPFRPPTQTAATAAPS